MVKKLGFDVFGLEEGLKKYMAWFEKNCMD